MSDEQNALSDEKFTQGAGPEESESTEESQSDAEDQSLESAGSDGEQSETGDSESSTEDSSANTKGKGVQKRISELTAARRSAERERDYWKSLAQEKPESVDEPTPPAPPDPSLRMDEPEKYEQELKSYQENLHQYNKDMAKWYETQRSAESQDQENEETKAELDLQFQQNVEAFKQEATDFESLVTRPDNPVSENMVEVAKRSEHGPQVLYELAKNPQEAMRIYHMNPIQTAHEMGKIEARLAVKPKTQSSAPDPVGAVSSEGESGGQSDEDMPIDQWMERERKRLAAKQE